MEIEKITNLIENFASPDTQEAWDCSGHQIYLGERNIKKILLCLSVTKDIMNQAIERNCDMIISHHPLFFVPFEFNKGISIYSSHTNLDKADGGTTDSLINVLGFTKAQKISDFLRLVELEEEILLDDFIKQVKAKFNLKNIRVVNNFGRKKIKNIVFCAGSGGEFLYEAEQIPAIDVFVTGDVKYHTALESNVIIFDIGHFESEKPVLKTIKNLLKPLNLEIVEADEKSPFINY